MRGFLASLCAAAACCVGGVPLAQAQLIDRLFPAAVPGYEGDPVVSVLRRIRPELVPAGVRFGALTIRPSASESAGYETNVLGTVRAQSSPVLRTTAGLDVATGWSRHAIGASFSLDDRRTPDVPAANRTDWSAFVGGALDLGRDRLSLGVGHVRQHLAPTDVTAIGVTAPVPYDSDSVSASYATRFGRLSVTPDLRFNSVRFADRPTGFHSLDRDIVSGGVALRYEVATDRGLVAVGRGASARYMRQGAGRDYTDGAVLAGVDLGGGVIRTRALAGFEVRSFGRGGKALSAPVVEADVIWAPTRLTTVTAVALRRIEDPAAPITGGLRVTEGRLTVDHELRRNLLAEAYGTIQTAQGTSGRSRTSLGGGTNITWLLSRRLATSVSYDLSRTRGGGSAFTDQSVIVSVRFGL